MKVKYGIIMLILLIISRSLFAQLPPNEKCIAFYPMHRMADDKTIKKEKSQEQKGNEENPDDNLDDDTNEHNDSDIDLEDIPDDFYDYEEEENF